MLEDFEVLVAPADRFVDIVLSPTRLELDKRVAALQTGVVEADDKLRRLYRMVEEGVTVIDEALNDRLDQLKTDRDRARAALDRIAANSDLPAAIEPEAV
jgi:site-specific DNA recombinase